MRDQIRRDSSTRGIERHVPKAYWQVVCDSIPLRHSSITRTPYPTTSAGSGGSSNDRTYSSRNSPEPAAVASNTKTSTPPAPTRSVSGDLEVVAQQVDHLRLRGHDPAVPGRRVRLETHLELIAHLERQPPSPESRSIDHPAFRAGITTRHDHDADECNRNPALHDSIMRPSASASQCRTTVGDRWISRRDAWRHARRLHRCAASSCRRTGCRRPG